jgi:hypothetical protein
VVVFIALRKKILPRPGALDAQPVQSARALCLEMMWPYDECRQYATDLLQPCPRRYAVRICTHQIGSR